MENMIEGLAANFTVSRRSNEMIYIQITDESSRSKFVELEMTPHDFTMALTGLSNISCKLAVHRLDTVGKKKQVESRKVFCPITTYEKPKLKQWIQENCHEEGWEIDAYLGSQGDVIRVDDGTMLRYSVFRYVDRAERSVSATETEVR